MNENLGFADWVKSALAELDYALQDDNVGSTVNALTYIGRAEISMGAQSLATSREAAPQRDALCSRASGHSDLFARAGFALDRPMRHRPESDGLVDSLLARTGFEVLLDIGVWPEPPLDAAAMAEIDEELAEGVNADPPDVPVGVPAAHRWWWPDPS